MRRDVIKEKIMLKKIWLAGTVLASGLAAGCADNEVDTRGASRQEGSLDTYQRERAYSPIMGDTSGDGMRRDMRTGGVITGDDVPARERLNEDTRTRINIDRQRENTGPIRGDSGTSSPSRSDDGRIIIEERSDTSIRGDVNTGTNADNGSLNRGAPGGGANTSTGVLSGTERDRRNASKGND
jgi:hypothetical protein